MALLALVMGADVQSLLGERRNINTSAQAPEVATFTGTSGQEC